MSGNAVSSQRIDPIAVETQLKQQIRKYPQASVGTQLGTRGGVSYRRDDRQLLMDRYRCAPILHGELQPRSSAPARDIRACGLFTDAATDVHNCRVRTTAD